MRKAVYIRCQCKYSRSLFKHVHPYSINWLIYLFIDIKIAWIYSIILWYSKQIIIWARIVLSKYLFNSGSFTLRSTGDQFITNFQPIIAWDTNYKTENNNISDLVYLSSRQVNVDINKRQLDSIEIQYYNKYYMSGIECLSLRAVPISTLEIKRSTACKAWKEILWDMWISIGILWKGKGCRVQIAGKVCSLKIKLNILYLRGTNK